MFEPVRRPLTLATVTMAALLFAHAARAASFTNGSFETGTPPGADMPLASGSTAVTGWVVTRAGIDYVGSAWVAAAGTRSIALNGPDAGGIAQTFTTVPHSIYHVRFYIAGDPGTLPAVKTMRVAAAGQSHDFSKDITGMWEWDPGWDLCEWNFQSAGGSSTTLEFYSTMTGTNVGPAIDSVSVSLVATLDAPFPDVSSVGLAPLAPDPARGERTLRFALPAAGWARLAVYDAAGRSQAVLIDGEEPAGEHQASWNAASAAPGVYYAELRTHAARVVRRFVVLR